MTMRAITIQLVMLMLMLAVFVADCGGNIPGGIPGH